jgi:hypothetical protein
LGFAEFIAHQGKIYPDNCGFYVKSDPGGEEAIFGRDDETNLELVNRNVQDLDANPDAGDAYVIARSNARLEKLGGCPFHVAYVFAQDGDTRITMEADAGQRMGSPVFDMYSVRGTTGKTFHNRYFREFGGHTTVLAKLPNPYDCETGMPVVMEDV